MRHLLVMALLAACTSVAVPRGQPVQVPRECFTAVVWKQRAAACFQTREACEAALAKAGKYADLAGLSDLSECGTRR